MTSKNSSKIDKAKYWTGILYLENMVDGWENDISDIVQVPFAYCVHDKDLDGAGEDRKIHVHLMLAFSNTTTFSHVRKVYNLLSAPNKVCCSTCQACVDVRRSYDYLIHDTESCRKKGKYQYPASNRILGNNFDIGAYEQVSSLERAAMCKELCDLIVNMNFTNFADFYVYVSSTYDDIHYFLIMMSYSGMFERLTKANYLKHTPEFYEISSPSQGHPPEYPPEIPPASYDSFDFGVSCPACGSVHLVKWGKKPSGSQVWKCKDCNKKFVK